MAPAPRLRAMLAALLLGAPLGACAAPPAADTVSFASLAAPIEVPFRLDGQRIIVPAMVNDEEGHAFLFDTGLTDMHLVTPETAGALGLRWTKSALAYDSAGRPFPAGRTRLESLRVGPLRLADEEVAVISLPPEALRQADGTYLSGILGDTLVEAFAVILDFDAQTLRLDNRAPEPTADTIVLPLSWQGNLLTTLVEIGGEPASLMVDTGDFGAVTLFDDIDRFDQVVPLTGPGSIVPVLGAAGPYELRQAELRSLRLAGREVGPMLGTLGPRGEGMPRHLDGRIGLGVLSAYKVVLDTRLRRMLLMPRAKPLVTAGPG